MSNEVMDTTLSRSQRMTVESAKILEDPTRPEKPPQNDSVSLSTLNTKKAIDKVVISHGGWCFDCHRKVRKIFIDESGWKMCKSCAKKRGIDVV